MRSNVEEILEREQQISLQGHSGVVAEWMCGISSGSDRRGIGDINMHQNAPTVDPVKVHSKRKCKLACHLYKASVAISMFANEYRR